MRRRLYFAFVVVVILLTTGTIFYSVTETWSPIDSFYFSTMTLTTVGFGDIAPTTEMGKIFTSFYALFGIGIVLYILSSVIGVFIFNQERYFDRIFFPVRKIRKREMEIKEKKKEMEKEEKEMSKEEKEMEKRIQKIREKEKEIEKERRKIEGLKKIIQKKVKK